MAIRSVPSPEVHPCTGCAGVMTPGTRYEETRTVAVLVCWDCGAETPPLYGARPSTAVAYCRYCGGQFVPGDPRERYCSDDHARRADRITLDRRSTGRTLRQIRRRA